MKQRNIHNLPPPFVAPLSFGWLSLCLAPRPALSSRLRPVTPLFTPLLFGWFVALPRDLAYCTDGCHVASRHAVASCASTPLIRESGRRRLPPLLPPHPSRTTSPSPEQERGLPEHRCFCCHHGARPLPEQGLPHHCHRRGRPCSRPSPAPPPTIAFAARAHRQGVAPRRERVRMDDEQCPRNTIGVRPECRLCEPVVTRLTQN